MQEQTCVHIKVVFARTCVHTQAQIYTCKNKHRRLFFNIFQVFSTKTQPKHVSIPSRVSGFHLNPPESKTQEFIGLKTN